MSGGVNSPRIVPPVGQKIDLAQGLVAAVKPGIQPPAMRRRPASRTAARPARKAARCGRSSKRTRARPGRSRCVQGACPAASSRRAPRLSQQRLRLGDFVRLEELVVLQGVAHRFLVDQHVRQERISVQFAGCRFQAFEPRFEFGAVRRGHFDSYRRHRLDGRSGRLRQRGDRECRYAVDGSHFAALSYRSLHFRRA